MLEGQKAVVSHEVVTAAIVDGCIGDKRKHCVCRHARQVLRGDCRCLCGLVKVGQVILQ